MKKALFAFMLVAAFALVAAAQDSKVGTLTASRAGSASASRSTAPVWGLPSVPGSAILFYGGDINVNDPNAQGFANENTLVVSQAQTYGAVNSPTTNNVVVTGAFGNNSGFGDFFDPAQGTYDVRTGVSEGNGGTSILSGTGNQSATATGRDPFGLIEYTTFVRFAKAITSTPGTTYWVNETPQCTNSGDSNCSGAEYFLSNTTQETNSVNGYAQPAGQIFFNSTYFGFTWANWCDASLGQNSQQCARASFGLTR